MNVIPMIAMINSSGEPKSKTMGLIMGMDKANDKAPIVDPTSELIIAAPSALPASPFFDIGYPSRMRAAEDPSPGIPKRIEVRSPVVPVTASIPSRKQKASMGVLIV